MNVGLDACLTDGFQQPLLQHEEHQITTTTGAVAMSVENPSENSDPDLLAILSHFRSTQQFGRYDRIA